MNLTEYCNYFEDIARHNAAIAHSDSKKHFFRINIEEVYSALPSKVCWPIMAIECFDGALEDNDSDNIQEKQMGAFMILKPVKKGDFIQENTVLDNCLDIGWQIIARMRKDKMNYLKGMEGFEISSVSYQKVNIVEWENAFGFRFSFTLGTQKSLAYNPENWLEEEEEEE